MAKGWGWGWLWHHKWWSYGVDDGKGNGGLFELKSNCIVEPDMRFYLLKMDLKIFLFPAVSVE